MAAEDLFLPILLFVRVLFAAMFVGVVTLWIRHRPNTVRQFVVSTALVTALGVAGVVILLSVGVDGGGAAWLTVFLALPAVAGATSVLLVPWSGAAIRTAIGITALVMTSALLIVSGIEGLICCLMASPLIAWTYLSGVIAGIALRNVSRRLFPDGKDTAMRSVAAFLLLLALPAAKSAEIEARTAYRRVEPIESRVHMEAAPQDVWDALEEIDAVHGPKPFLLRIGLPVPISCTLEGTGIGARRTCYFDVGQIDERVSVWDPPVRMELEIVSWTLPGRHWLGYEGARYDLLPSGYGTEVVRTTTITSNLGPAWYWRPLERMGVHAEHEYLLQDVKRRVEVPAR